MYSLIGISLRLLAVLLFIGVIVPVVVKRWRLPVRLGLLLPVLGLVAAPWVLWQLFWIAERISWPNPSDPIRAAGTASFVADHFSFTQKSKTYPDRPPIYNNIDPWLLHPTVVVYTITDREQQDRIIDLVRQYKEREGLGTILVKFYREENWTTRKTRDGGEAGSRGEEELLRTEKLR